MPELIGEPYCFLTSDADSFTKQINQALGNRDRVNEQIYLRQNSWIERAKQIDDFISSRDINKSVKRNEMLREFLCVYNSYKSVSPLLEVLKAELLHELGQLEQAKIAYLITLPLIMNA
ncbi:glycosyltransferase family 1 protein [Bacillus megaterium]|nr:glycosyltransferase family 1 protein [Priestia megaterium]